MSWLRKAVNYVVPSSKKVLALSTGVIMWGARSVGVDIPIEAAQWVTGLLGSYILGQGAADFGKNKKD